MYLLRHLYFKAIEIKTVILEQGEKVRSMEQTLKLLSSNTCEKVAYDTGGI